jgi:RimJ/RimL family protein N-acetyltransferase
MRDADLAIGAAGTTSWERCCLGIPSIALVLAENQRAGGEALDMAGAAISVDSVDAVGPALDRLLEDADLRSSMSAASFAITDGLGTERVVATMLGARQHLGKIELRSASMDDAELLWLWRNDPVTRAQSRNTEPVSWADHVRWLSFTLADPTRHLFIAESGGTPIGMIRFDPAEGGTDEVSINVAPDRRWHGLGAAILKIGCAQIHSQRIVASVSESNHPSRRLFESCGFKPAESAEPGFLRYALDVPQRRRKLA